MSLRVHHLNCGTMCPVSQAFFNGQGAWFKPGETVCHCLLIETDQGLVLVDTGLGLDDIRRRKISPALDWWSPPRYELAETAYEQVKALGFKPDDVKHIVLTHMDLDHAAGILDFPGATVHLHRQEYKGARYPLSLPELLRYQPRHVKARVKWQTYEPLGEVWYGFEAVRPLVGLPPDILLIPLPGHSRGHTGVAVKTSQGWLLHCGDAYFDRRQLQGPLPFCPPGLMLLQLAESANHLQWAHNLLRLGQLKAKHPEVELFCAHDPTEFYQLTGTLPA